MNGQARGSISTLLAIIVALPTVGQESDQTVEPRLVWRVPERGFVEFTRKVSKISPQELVGTIHGKPASVPGFYAHELENGRTLDFDHSTLLDVVAEVALSLSGERPRKGRKHRVTQRFDACYRFGGLRVRGIVTTSDISNPTAIRQAGKLKLTKFKAVIPEDGPKLSSLERRGSHDIEGAVITFDRVVDAVRGRVSSFTAKLSGTIFPTRESKETGKGLTIEVSWECKGIEQPGTASFRKRVSAAIERGQKYMVEHVMEWLGKGKIFHKPPDNLRRHLGTGYLSLVLMTLCKGNPDRAGEAIQACLEELRRRVDPEDTYALATAIMAIESYYEPANEAWQIRSGLLEAPTKRKLSPSDRELVAAWTKRLLANRDTSTSSYRWRFRYHGEKNFDNSCTQFGVLGLAAAERCGMKMPAKLWTGLAPTTSPISPMARVCRSRYCSRPTRTCVRKAWPSQVSGRRGQPSASAVRSPAASDTRIGKSRPAR